MFVRWLVLGFALLNSLASERSLGVCASGDASTALIEEILTRPAAGWTASRSCSVLSEDARLSRWRPDGDWPASACVPFYNLGSVCAAAEGYCSERNQASRACSHDQWRMNPETGEAYPLCLSDEQLLENHRSKVEYAGRRFHEMTHSSDLQTRCCGRDTACKRRFSQVSFRLLLGLGADDRTGHFTNRPPSLLFSSDQAVEASVGFLTSFVSPAAMDGFFYHELGHACHSVRLNTGDDLFRTALPRSSEETMRSMREFVGSELSSCVKEGLQRAWNGLSADARSDTNYDEWYEEAHADAIYASSRYATPAGVAWQCSAIQDSEHASPLYYLGCYLMRPEFKAAICGPSQTGG